MGRAKGNRHHGKRSSTVILVLSMLLMLSGPSLSPSAPRRILRWSKGYATKKSEGDGLGERWEQWTEILSWEPRAFLYHNFLSKEECEYLINLAKPHMVKSTVVDSKTGKSKDSRVRTSSGTFLRRGRDKVITDIEKRIADFTFIPADQGEGLQVLHYEEGQKYEPHKKVVRRFFLLPKAILTPRQGGMRSPHVLSEVFLFNLKWVMHYFSGVCDLMLVWILQACMVVACYQRE